MAKIILENTSENHRSLVSRGYNHKIVDTNLAKDYHHETGKSVRVFKNGDWVHYDSNGKQTANSDASAGLAAELGRHK